MEYSIRGWEDQINELEKIQVTEMSRTLSVLILENFVINEGPKWEKFKSGVKKVGYGAAALAGGAAIALGGAGGAKISDANRNYDRDIAISQSDHEVRRNELDLNKSMDINNINSDNTTTPETKKAIKSQIIKNYNRSIKGNDNINAYKRGRIAERKDIQHAKGNQALAAAGALSIAPLLAGAHALSDKKLKMMYHNNRINANTKKANKNLDKLEKAKKKWGNDQDGKPTIDNLDAKINKNVAKIDSHTDKYKEAHYAKHKKLAKKVLYKPGEVQKVIRDPRRLDKIPNPALFFQQAEDIAKSNNRKTGDLSNLTAEQKVEAAKQTKQVQQAGGTPEYNEKPKEAPKTIPTTKVTPTTVQTPHQKIASNAASVKERLSKVRGSM